MLEQRFRFRLSVDTRACGRKQEFQKLVVRDGVRLGHEAGAQALAVAFIELLLRGQREQAGGVVQTFLVPPLGHRTAGVTRGRAGRCSPSATA